MKHFTHKLRLGFLLMAGACLTLAAQAQTEIEHKTVTINFSELGVPTLTTGTDGTKYFSYKLDPEKEVYLEILPLVNEYMLSAADAGESYGGSSQVTSRKCLIFPRASSDWWAANKPQYYVRVVGNVEGYHAAMRSFKITGSTLPVDLAGLGGATIVFGDLQQIEDETGDPEYWYLGIFNSYTAGYEGASTFHGIYFNVNTQNIEVDQIDVTYALIPQETEAANTITTISDVVAENLVDLSTTKYVQADENDEHWLTIDRTFRPGWNTICLPFTVTPEEVLGEGARANQFVSYDPQTNMVTFKEVEYAMAENTPYLIWNPSDEDVSDVKVAKEMVHAGALKEVGSNDLYFCGNYKAGMSMEGLYGVVNKSKTQSYILKGAHDSTLNGLRAYFQYRGTAEMTSMSVTLGDGSVTSIENILGNAEDANAPIYDIMGRRVNQTVRGQLYIRAGKKFIAE